MKYYPKLDGLRFVAIALVLLEHFANGIANYIAVGYYGVNLFFTVSGFLITSILLHSDGGFWVSYKNFIARRSLRIFPIYYLTVFVLFLLQADVIHQYLFHFLTYTYNYILYFYPIPDNPVNHFWSLCFEEQFYLVWPFLVLLLKHKKQTLIIISTLLLSFCVFQLSYKHLNGSINYRQIGLYSSIGFLTTGCLTAILYNTNTIPEYILKSKNIEYLIWLLLLISLTTNLPVKYAILMCCTAFIILKSVDSDFAINAVNTLLTNKKVIFIGTISYGIYIYHLPVAYYFEEYVFNPVWKSIDFNAWGILKKLQWYAWVIKLPLFSALSIAVAYLSFRFIEKPILRLKKKFA